MAETGSIAIFTTGGTIDKIYFDELSAFQVGSPQIGEVLKHAHVNFTFRAHPLMRKDSLEITAEDRAEIAAAIRACPEQRILITHGTDTMVETACTLGSQSEKTVVLTGSLTPARFRESDAIFNIGFAAAAVQILPPGVYITMNGTVFPLPDVRKNREANRFERTSQ
ncbi:MAG: asparaginase [Opitutales bacterium]|nr:asparaginase [Opitutales bacterium]